MALIVVKPLIKNKLEKEWQMNLFSHDIANIANYKMNKFDYLNVFIDSKKQVVILCDINPIKYWHGAVNELENTINRCLNINNNVFKKHVGISPQDYKLGITNKSRN